MGAAATASWAGIDLVIAGVGAVPLFRPPNRISPALRASPLPVFAPPLMERPLHRIDAAHVVQHRIVDIGRSIRVVRRLFFVLELGDITLIVVEDNGVTAAAFQLLGLHVGDLGKLFKYA